MEMKTEALKLADELEGYYWESEDEELTPSKLIRRLVEELDKLKPSVFTILTCGCKSEFMGFPSEWDGETRECEPCVNYGSLCEQHFMEYEARPAQYTPQTKKSEPVVYWDGKHFASKEKSSLADIPLYTTPQTKPLSDDEINNIVWQQKLLMGNDDLRNFARAIEERHEIK